MRVVDAVWSPNPSRVWLDFGAGRLHFLEPTKEQAPNIAFPRWQGSIIGQRHHAGPGDRQLHGPAPVHDRIVVKAAVDMNRALQTRKVPVEEGPSRAARVRPPPECFRFPI